MVHPRSRYFFLAAAFATGLGAGLEGAFAAGCADFAGAAAALTGAAALAGAAAAALAGAGLAGALTGALAADFF